MPRHERTPAVWFSFGIKLFALALPLGVVVALMTPFAFVQGLGAFVTMASAFGVALSVLGLRSEAPTRWSAWQHDWSRALAPVRRQRNVDATG